ncbi:hypothetical protein MNBD_GAMMA16-786 [hydrothermal vent metagenome]|uniref:Uncharacterized protein n=1 Tax=hydrothermal vent metagenome TaxID=652676 RepID=A0A3B0ZZL7_9ZZZZ
MMHLLSEYEFLGLTPASQAAVSGAYFSFSKNKATQTDAQQTLIDELYKQTGQLKVENDFLKKSH